jgi:hypothetical protein
VALQQSIIIRFSRSVSAGIPRHGAQPFPLPKQQFKSIGNRENSQNGKEIKGAEAKQ